MDSERRDMKRWRLNAYSIPFHGWNELLAISNGKSVKPSFAVSVKMDIEVKKRFINYKYNILGLTDKRVGAKLLNNFLMDNTPQEELIKNKINLSMPTYRTKTMKGRPTKKERRDMEKIKSKFGEI